MKTVSNYRACGILYNFLRSNAVAGTVLMPANICETVPATYMKAGLDVEFFDISLKDLSPDAGSMYGIIGSDEDITVLHYNHTYGYLARQEDEKLFENLKDRFPGLIIIDDRCLCVPSPAPGFGESFADMYLYSTGHVKYADIGYGGFAHIRDCFDYKEHYLPYSEEAETAFDKYIKYCHAEHCSADNKIMTGNWLKNESVAGDYFVEVKKAMDRIRPHKKAINEIYEKLTGVGVPYKYNTWRYQVLVKNQNECINAIFDNGLFASRHYMSLGNGYFKLTETPNADWLAAHVVNLFNDFRVDIEMAKRTVNVLNKVMIPIEVS